MSVFILFFRLTSFIDEIAIDRGLYMTYKRKLKAAKTYKDQIEAFTFGKAWLPDYYKIEKPRHPKYQTQLKFQKEALK